MAGTLSNMFEFFLHFDDYEERKVDRYEKDRVMISTARVYDSDLDFETAVQHPAFNGGRIVIVECYSTREEAAVGHQRWVAKMTADRIPAVLEDVSSYCLAKFARAAEGSMFSERGKRGD